MDNGLLLLFLVAGSWLYGAMMLAMLDWRWHLGRIAQYLIFGGIGAWAISAWKTPAFAPFHQPVLILAVVLFAANVLVPAYAQRRMVFYLLNGQFGAARFWQFMLVVLTWRAPSTLFHVLPDDPRDMPSWPAARQYGRLMAGICGAFSRRSFFSRQMEALIAMGRIQEGIRVFERRFGKGGLAPEPVTLYSAAIGYAELGDLRAAAGCLRLGEMNATAHDREDLRRLAANLRIYSLCGKPADIERFLAENPALAAQVSPAAIKLRLGMAHLRAGEPLRARQVLADALPLAASEEARYRDVIENLLLQTEGPAESISLAPEIQADLDAAARHQAAFRARREPLYEAGPPFVTWATMAALIDVWLITERLGSSTDPRVLLQMGANVPALIRAGEWWRLVSSIFLHVGWLHLFFNCLACLIFGRFVEQMAGRWEAITTLIASGIAGSILSSSFGSHAISAGASGGMFGLLGAATVITLRFRDIFPPHMRRANLASYLFLAGASVFQGLVEPHLDNLAHGGGLAAGVLLGFLVGRNGRDGVRRRLFVLAGIASLLTCLWAGEAAYRYARQGAYPRQIPAMSAAIAADGAFKIEVPVFWRRLSPGSDRMEFFDPFEAELKVFRVRSPRPLHVTADSNETIVRRVKRQVGSNSFEEVCVVAEYPETKVANFVFQKSSGPYTYVLKFACEASDAGAYQPLLDVILGSLEISERGETHRDTP